MSRRAYAVTFEISSEEEEHELMTYVRLIKKHEIPYELEQIPIEFTHSPRA